MVMSDRTGLARDPEQKQALPRRPSPDRAALERLTTLGAEITVELDPKRLIQRVTDEATALVRAEVGAFFHNVKNAQTESYVLYGLSGVSRDAFADCPMPRKTAVFASTFDGTGMVRSDDITQDPRYGKNAPHHGMPEGHWPVRSYLAVPVKSIQGEVLGGLFFGHSRPGMFDEADERALAALAPIAGSALTNARLFESLRHREAELRSSELRYRLVSEAMQEGIWYWDVETNQVQWNDRLLELMGVRRDQWGGTFDDWYQRLHPEDQPRLAQALKDHLERRLPYRVESFRLLHADGEYRWCTTAGQAEWDESGKPLRMAGSFRDVTDRKQFEDRLRDSELRYSQILDSIHDMVLTRDEQGRITWANRAACRLYGMNVEQLRGSTGGAEDASAASADRAVFSSGQIVERQESPQPTPQGEQRIYHTVKTPLRNRDGQIKELVAVSRDITARKRELDTQRLLAQASAILGASMDYERTLRELVHVMVPTFADWAAVDVLDDAGEVKRLAFHHRDPQMCKLARLLQEKYPPNLQASHGLGRVLRTKQLEHLPEISREMIRAAARDAEHAESLERLGLKSMICAPIVVGDRAVGALTFVAAESKRRYVDNDVDFAAEVAHRAAVAIDNARLYQQLREMTNTLEQRVQERTAALTEINQELEAFSYTVSHDLRAPVRHIGGFVDLLREVAGDSLDSQALRYLTTIKNAATQMGTLIDGLLTFSRLGRTQLAKRPVALSELVTSVIRQMTPDLANRQIAWSVGPLPTVLADGTMLQLVMVNLIDNAVKYTRGRTQACIEVGAKREAKEYLVWVRDNGVGFDMQYVDKLFGVFQRLHGEEQFEGTGIGLASVRRIIVRHGGRAWAVSELGQGSTFYFTLPIEESQDE